MADNLKVTRYPDGSIIPKVEDRLTWFSFALYTRAYCWYDNYSNIGAEYGGLYTWPAAMNINSESDIKPGSVQVFVLTAGICQATVNGSNLRCSLGWAWQKPMERNGGEKMKGARWTWGNTTLGKSEHRIDQWKCFRALPQDGVMVQAISRILGHLPGSGPPRRGVITPGYGSWIIILPGYIVAQWPLWRHFCPLHQG